MRTMLTTPTRRWPWKPLTELIDRRVATAWESHGAAAPADADIADLRRQLADTQRRQRTLELLLNDGGRGMARMPSPANIKTLVDEIAVLTGDRAAAERNVACAFRVLVAFESLGVGRVAGGTMNICGKLATIPLLEAPNDDVLEIGTLYGLFAASLLRMLQRAGRNPQLTVVDPLIGVQLQPGTTERPDASGTPVHENAVRTNLSLAGTAGVATRICRGYSTDPAVRADVGDRQYGAIIVDGDHSQEGVAADLKWVEDIVAPGAIVVLDDYGDRKWPGVQAALDNHLAAGSGLTLLGRVATSGYLRASDRP